MLTLYKHFLIFLEQIGITIVDDNQWEPDEEFFVKLTLIPGEESEKVKLGKTCIMEITILNDDGKYGNRCLFPLCTYNRSYNQE